jgi:PAS domain S-box-containing protein
MLKILVVDNHPMILKLLEGRFTPLGHQVRTALDGLQALDVLREFVPDILFLDLVMPNIDGEQLCRIIRQDPRLAGIYVVILSAIAAEHDCDPKRIGADACIAKGAFSKIGAHLDAVLDQVKLPQQERMDLGVLGLDQVYQREITKELLHSRCHAEIILHNMTEGVLEMTPQQRLIYLNPPASALLGATEEVLLGRELPSLLPPHPARAVRSILANLAVPDLKTLRIGPEDIYGHQVMIDFFPVQDDSGKEIDTIIVRFHDITERMRVEKDLRQTTFNLQQVLANLQQTQTVMVHQEKLASIGTLASGVAHEILNPLNIISSIVQLLIMDEPPTAQREQLEEVMTQIRRATKITNNLRMFSHRQEETSIVEVDVHDLFDKTALLVEHDLNLDNIRLERDFAPDLPKIMADDDQLAQVFMNLISNARAAMRDRPERRITIRTRPAENGITISFIDTGHGIAKKHLTKIFDPFFSTKDPGEGTGLGLSIVYSIIDNYNGTIEVFSEEGRGTEFFIYLPHDAAIPGKERKNDKT